VVITPRRATSLSTANLVGQFINIANLGVNAPPGTPGFQLRLATRDTQRGHTLSVMHTTCGQRACYQALACNSRSTLPCYELLTCDPNFEHYCVGITQTTANGGSSGTDANGNGVPDILEPNVRTFVGVGGDITTQTGVNVTVEKASTNSQDMRITSEGVFTFPLGVTCISATTAANVPQ
jgi:hypothetical protein